MAGFENLEAGRIFNMAADARRFVMKLFRISNEVAFADHMTKCCILIGRAKKCPNYICRKRPPC